MKGYMKYISILIMVMAFAAVAAAAPPTITDWGNTKTNDELKTIMINESESVSFNATANQTINMWHWSRDGVNQTHNFDNFPTSWSDNGTYTVAVTAENASNGTSIPVIWTITVNDTTPPAQVQGLGNGTVTDTTVYLGWTANTESDLAGYNIYYQNGSHIASISATNHYTVQNLSPSTTYVFNVSAYDSGGLEGEESDGWSVTTAAAATSSGGPPAITVIKPIPTDDTTPESDFGETMTFEIEVNQTVTITWYINETEERERLNVESDTYENDRRDCARIDGPSPFV